MRWISNQGYLLLLITSIAWVGNTIIGKGVTDIIPPVGLAFWRWALTLPIFLALAWPHLRKDLPELVRQWKILLLLTILSISVYNTFIYVGLTETSAINAFLINTSRPAMIVVLSFIITRERVTRLQIVGLTIALFGTMAIVSKGEPAVFLNLEFNTGDLWILAATGSWALYTVLLPRRPKVHQTSFLFGAVVLGLLVLSPFYGWETINVRPVPIRIETFGSVAYLAVLSSVLAYLCYNRAVELLGANRASITSYILPLLGTVLAIVLLGETFRTYHGVGFVFILIGIYLVARARKAK